MKPIHRPVGTSVIFSQKCFEIVQQGNRSVTVRPSSDYVTKIKRYIGQQAVVTDDFSPSYERTIRFSDGQHFHVKDHWVESI